MDILSAVQWVEDNKCTIIGFAKKYELYCPYGYDDFLSAAHEAAILASMQQPAYKKQFLKIFWTGFKKILSDIVPNPLHEDWSRSVPSNMCVELPPGFTSADDITANAYLAPDFLEDKEPQYISLDSNIDLSLNISGENEVSVSNYMENIFLQSKGYLRPNQRTLLYLLLGLDENVGQCSEKDVAIRLGMSQQHVSKIFKSTCVRIARLMRNKKINLESNIKNYQNPPP